MEIKFSNRPLLAHNANATILFLEQNFEFSSELQGIAHKFFPTLQEFMKESEFIAKPGQSLIVPCSADNKNHTLIFMGLGKKEHDGIIVFEVYRRALGHVIKVLQSKKLNNSFLKLPEAALFGVSSNYLGEQTVIIAHMAGYLFDEYITDQSRKVNHNVVVTLVADAAIQNDIEQGMRVGAIIAYSVNAARHWVDLPPTALPPMELASKARAIAQKFGLPITILTENEIIKLGMGGLSGVSAGSVQDAQLIMMEYKTDAVNAPTIAFVGKGITFDSGGLSLKPASAMETMKEDMSGAAAVIAAMSALAQLKPSVNIVAVAPICENMPSGTATKPGDIVRFYNKKTAEVKNTDAEGRLILADALSYPLNILSQMRLLI